MQSDELFVWQSTCLKVYFLRSKNLQSQIDKLQIDRQINFNLHYGAFFWQFELFTNFAIKKRVSRSGLEYILYINHSCQNEVDRVF